jgi:hypothetical protein
MILRQLVDAGTLSNLPGGLKSRGLRIKGDDTPIAPGEFRDVDVPSGAIRDNILMLPYKEPSQVLNALMNQIIEEGRAFANAEGLKVSDMSANAPVGTTLAILERTLKVTSAIQSRIYYAMRQEFRLLKGIIRDYTPSEYNYDPEIGDRRAKQADYDNCDVIPVSDPNASTMSQKVVQYQAVMQMAAASPQIYDQVELNKQMLEVLGIKNIGKLIPAAEDFKPKDPVSENMNIINGKPVKAFIYQDHEAHIAVHMAAMQDPKIQQMVGQNPQSNAIQAAAMAHINEHVAFEYRKQLEEQLGVPLPNMDETLPEDIEYELSKLMSDAARKLLQKDQSEVQQQQAQQQQQDPIVQMQQQELQLKAQDLQIKQQKTMADIQSDLQRLALDKMRIESQERIAGAQIGANAVMDDKQLEAKQLLEGTRIGVEAVRANEQLAHQKDQSEKQHAIQRQQIMQQRKQKEQPQQPQE